MTPAQVLLDTNLLLLLVVGTASRDLIAKHKRLTQFVAEDYEVLRQVVARAPEVLVTPNTLTETSNLAMHIAEPARGRIMSVLQQVITISDERYLPSTQAADRAEFPRLGLTDAVLLEVATSGATLLTTDLDLYRNALAKGLAAVNFNHIRDKYL